MARFFLLDPTNVASSGLGVTLFEKSEMALPRPEVGDVLLLRNIAVSNLSSYQSSYLILISSLGGQQVQQQRGRSVVQGMAMGNVQREDGRAV